MVGHQVECGPASRLLVFVACAAVALAASCGSASSTLPGTSLGTYNVTGTLGTNTCGAGLGAPSPWNFTSQMSEDGTTFYWEMSGASALSSTMASATQVSITATQTANVDTSDAGVPGPCNLQGTTALTLTL